MPPGAYPGGVNENISLGQGLGPVLCRTFHIARDLEEWVVCFNKKLSHCTWTGTGKNTSIHHRAHFQDLKNGYQTYSSGPENIPGVLLCPCSGAVWKVLIKTYNPFFQIPVPVPVLVPDQASVNTPWVPSAWTRKTYRWNVTKFLFKLSFN